MNSEQFLNEVIESDLCPKNFENIFEEFSEYQQAAIDTLNEFHRICVKNNIRYQLAYGSLLGAIRDHGQIPWDYDIDVFIPISYKDRLIIALSSELDNRFYFNCPEVNAKCCNYMIRLAPKGYDTEAMHVDVFYLIGAPEDGKERLILANKVKDVFCRREHKLKCLSRASQKNIKIFLWLLKLKLRSVFYTVKKLDKSFNEICFMYDMDETKRCISVDAESDRRFFNSERMWDTKLITTDIGEFMIPKNYDEILTQLYGDFNCIFPLKDRLRELLIHYERLKYYDSITKK